MNSIEKVLMERGKELELNGKKSGEIVINEPVSGIFKYNKGEEIQLKGTSCRFEFIGRGEDGGLYFEYRI